MAYRRKTRSHRRKPARRRRMGAVSRRSGGATRLIGLVVGAVAPALISSIKMKDGKTLDAKIVGGISVAAGYFLPTFIKGEIFQGIGDGMIAGGGAILVNDLGLLNGLPLIAGPGFNAINGPGKQSTDSFSESAASTVYRPSFSQMMNGMYNREYRD